MHSDKNHHSNKGLYTLNGQLKSGRHNDNLLSRCVYSDILNRKFQKKYVSFEKFRLSGMRDVFVATYKVVTFWATDSNLVTLLKMRSHYGSRSSRENATPSSGTSLYEHFARFGKNVCDVKFVYDVKKNGRTRNSFQLGRLKGINLFAIAGNEIESIQRNQFSKPCRNERTVNVLTTTPINIRLTLRPTMNRVFTL